MSSCQKMRQNIASQHLAWPAWPRTDGFMISNQCCCCRGGDTVTYRQGADTCPAPAPPPAPALTSAIKINPSLSGRGNLESSLSGQRRGGGWNMTLLQPFTAHNLTIVRCWTLKYKHGCGGQMSISPPRWQCCPLPDAGWLLPSPAPLGRARPYQPLWLLVLLSPSSHHCTSTTPGEVIPYPGQSTWQIIFPATKQRKLRCWANCPTMTRHYSGHWPAGCRGRATKIWPTQELFTWEPLSPPAA